MLLAQRCVSGPRGPLSPADRRQILAANEEMARRALRVIGVARRELSLQPRKLESGTVERDLTFLGLFGMADPPRREVRGAVERCHQAGIRPVMITGDHRATALAVARELDIFRPGDLALTGAELDFMPQEVLEEDIEKFSVFARVSPEHKMRIVRAWQKRGNVVAMTGDGVNDAPALKAADIGCAMGGTGTDVAKGAADMILTDDNFATIVYAVEQGRGIYSNIKKAIHYLLSCNIGEILTIFTATVLDFGQMPLVPVQLLWLNLVTDSLPALALGVEPVEEGVMDQPPYLLGLFHLGAPGMEGAVANTMAFATLTAVPAVSRLQLQDVPDGPQGLQRGAVHGGEELRRGQMAHKIPHHTAQGGTADPLVNITDGVPNAGRVIAVITIHCGCPPLSHSGQGNIPGICPQARFGSARFGRQ